MKNKKLITMLALIFSLSAIGCTTKVQINGAVEKKMNIDDKNINVSEIVKDNINPEVDVQVKAVTITMQQIADFLQTRLEHYPLSDEFIERYQQTSGGYIENAKKAGMIVDKQMHEPNQKWHFFESWLYPSIEDGSLTWDESAKSRVYSKLLCPELLLWIYEACGVDPNKVREAKIVAEQGKVAKTNVSTIAKNMRAIVSWEDLEAGIIAYLNNVQ